MPQETLAARNELLEKFLAMQQEGQQESEPSVGAGSRMHSPAPGGDGEAGVRAVV